MGRRRTFSKLPVESEDFLKLLMTGIEISTERSSSKYQLPGAAILCVHEANAKSETRRPGTETHSPCPKLALTKIILQSKGCSSEFH